MSKMGCQNVTMLVTWLHSREENQILQGCQTRGLLRANLHIGAMVLRATWVGLHCICEQSRRGPHVVLDSGITISLGNDLWNLAQRWIDLQKKKEKLPLNDKDLYLYSVACDQNFTRLFVNCPLQYYQSSLVISESFRGPHWEAQRAASLTPLIYCIHF